MKEKLFKGYDLEKGCILRRLWKEPLVEQGIQIDRRQRTGAYLLVGLRRVEKRERGGRKAGRGE